MANVNVSAPVGAISILRTVDFALALKDQLVAWNENRLTRQMLAELTDTQLTDIGLSRGDIDTI